MKRTNLIVTALLTTTLLSGCADTLGRVEQIGKSPPISDLDNPAEAPGHEHLSWPMPETPPPPKQYANSLWQPGARAFFRDGRAARVGDILRVNVNIKDKAELDNQTQGQRTAANTVAVPQLLGLQDKFKVLAPLAQPSNLVSASGAINNQGTGNAKRQEIVQTQVAALITQILPNGNFVIEGKTEMKIDYDIREVSVKGVVRPQDINSDNTIDSTQIAQARITYSGRGQLMDMQNPGWGSQLMSIIAPF